MATKPLMVGSAQRIDTYNRGKIHELNKMEEDGAIFHCSPSERHTNQDL